MLNTLYVGGCNAEHVALRVSGSQTPKKIYRIPTACFGTRPFRPGMFEQYRDAGDNAERDELWRRVAYEAERRYMTRLQEETFDLILIDLWRDSYLRLVNTGAGFLSLGHEIMNYRHIYDPVVATHRISQVGEPLYEASFEAGLALFAATLAEFQPGAMVVLLDCPPVTQSLREGVLQDLEPHFEVAEWQQIHYPVYGQRLAQYGAALPGHKLVRVGADAHTAPDAPWGEAPIHYATPFYAEMAAAVDKLLA